MAGFNNDIVYGTNVDFSGNSTVSQQITQDGQLIIGGTSLNSGGTHINIGKITSPASTITVGYSSPNILLDVNSSKIGETITGDSGGALSPTTGNWNILGGSGISTSGSGSTLTITNTNTFNPNAVINLKDDFENWFSGSPSVSEMAWNQNATNNWSPIQTGLSAFASSGHPGIIGHNNVTSAQLSLGNGFAPNANSAQFVLGGGVLTITWIVNINALSNVTNRYTFRCGMGDTVNGAMANGIYFEYSDNLNSGNWNIVTAAASVRTTTNTSVAVTTGWHKFQISVNAAASSVTYTIDGAAQTPISTNIPTASIQPLLTAVWSAGTIAANTILVDLFYLTQTLTTPR